MSGFMDGDRVKWNVFDRGELRTVRGVLSLAQTPPLRVVFSVHVDDGSRFLWSPGDAHKLERDR